MNAEQTLNTHTITIKRYDQGTASDREESVVAERSISLFVNGKEAVRLMSLPDQIEELAAGFLYSECVVSRREDIAKISFNPTAMSVEVQLAEHIQPMFSDKIRSVTTGCGRGLTFVSALNSSFFSPIISQASVAPQTIIDLMRRLQRKSSLFHDTGGVHSAAVAVTDEILFSADDIGRHNAVDKVLGWLLQSDRLTPDAENNRMLLTTGRLSSEIVTKAVRGRFAFLISPSAPTSGAVQLAGELGITLVGFARGERFNVYTHPERVTL